jgi:hypothetical protein
LEKNNKLSPSLYATQYTPLTENMRQFSQTLSFLCFFSWPTQKRNQKSSLPLFLLNHSKISSSFSISACNRKRKGEVLQKTLFFSRLFLSIALSNSKERTPSSLQENRKIESKELSSPLSLPQPVAHKQVETNSLPP